MQKPHFYERSIKTESIDLGLRAIIQWIYRDGYCEQCPIQIVRNVSMLINESNRFWDPDDEMCQNRCMMKKNRKLLASSAKNDYLCSTQGMDDGDTLHCCSVKRIGHRASFVSTQGKGLWLPIACCSTCGIHVSFA